MEYRKFDNVIVARIDKDEEILEQLSKMPIFVLFGLIIK